MRIDPFQLIQGIPSDSIRRKVLDSVLSFSIPFNLGQGFQIQDFSEDQVVVVSPPKFLRRNHIGGAHACSLALLGEYTAGLWVAQSYPISNYRVMIGKLEIEYFKQGRGRLQAMAQGPAKNPEFKDHQAWVDMRTEITNSDLDLVAVCSTRWQVKAWDKVRAPSKSGAT